MLITIAIAGMIGFAVRKIRRKRRFRRQQRKYQRESMKLRKREEEIGRRERKLRYIETATDAKERKKMHSHQRWQEDYYEQKIDLQRKKRLYRQ